MSSDAWHRANAIKGLEPLMPLAAGMNTQLNNALNNLYKQAAVSGAGISATDLKAVTNIKNINQDPLDIVPKTIKNVPIYLEKNTLKPFVEQLCREIELFRYTNEGQSLVSNGARFSAVPACVVSRKVFNYMLMACNPIFKRPDGTSADRLTYATVRKVGEDPHNINYAGVSTHNGNLFSIANNALDAVSFIDNATSSYEEMKIVSAQSTIRFGIDPDLEDWQARVCFDDGSNPKLTVGMTDNRLYE